MRVEHLHPPCCSSLARARRRVMMSRPPTLGRTTAVCVKSGSDTSCRKKPTLCLRARRRPRRRVAVSSPATSLSPDPARLSLPPSASAVNCSIGVQRGETRPPVRKRCSPSVAPRRPARCCPSSCSRPLSSHQSGPTRTSCLNPSPPAQMTAADHAGERCHHLTSSSRAPSLVLVRSVRVSSLVGVWQEWYMIP